MLCQSDFLLTTNEDLYMSVPQSVFRLLTIATNMARLTMGSKRRHDLHKDSGYSWVILLGVFGVSFFHLGIVKVFGVFVPELVEQLGLSMWTVGMSCSVGISLNALLGPLWTAATRVVSYRVLTISGGVVSSLGVISLSFSNSGVHLASSMTLISLGAGLPLVAKVVALKDYFQTKFSIANGIAFTGGALGFAVFAPLMEHFIDKYGWRGAMRIYAAMNLNVCVAGTLMKQPANQCARTSKSLTEAGTNASRHPSNSLEPSSNNSLNMTNTSQTLTNTSEPLSNSVPSLSETSNYVSKIPTFSSKDSGSTCCDRFLDNFGFSVLAHYPVLTVYLLAMSLQEFVAGGWLVFLVPYSVSIGFNVQASSYLTTLGGLGALFGRLVVGPFVDGGFISGRMMFCVLASFGAIVMLVYPFTSMYWILCIVSFLTGFFLASTSPIFVVMLKDLLQEDSKGFAGAVGLHYMARGFGTLLGGPITGWLHDATDSFHLSFLVLAMFEASAAVMTLIQPSCLPQVRGYKIFRQA